MRAFGSEKDALFQGTGFFHSEQNVVSVLYQAPQAADADDDHAHCIKKRSSWCIINFICLAVAMLTFNGMHFQLFD